MKIESADITVLHISTADSWRGGEQQLAYLVSEFTKKNIKQKVICRKDSAMESYCLSTGIEYEACVKRSSFDFTFAKKISEICNREGYKIVHSHDSHAHTFALLAVLFYGLKSKLIVSRRVDFPIGNNFLSSFKYNHKSVKRIICVSDAIRKITIENVGDATKVVTVHSGIDTSKFSDVQKNGLLHKEFNLPQSYKIVGNVSAIAPHKDYFTFVDTVELINKRESNIAFFVIGDGPERRDIENYIKLKNLEGVIHLTGFRKDIPQILPELDVMLITSETEGLGTSILDAFACKVPVVATAAGGIPEIVIHDQTGLLAPVKDATGLAEMVSKLLNDNELRKTLIAGARNHLNLFSKENTASKTLSEYLAVTDSSL